MTRTYEATIAAAKTLAGFEGDAWIFDPPKMDGITRSATHSSVYIRRAEAVLDAAENAAKNITPAPEPDQP